VWSAEAGGREATLTPQFSTAKDPKDAEKAAPSIRMAMTRGIQRQEASFSAEFAIRPLVAPSQDSAYLSPV
jgi:hypothetical protein